MSPARRRGADTARGKRVRAKDTSRGSRAPAATSARDGRAPSPSPSARVFFESPLEFRQWLERHHESVPLLWVGFHRRHTKRPSLTWPESVDEALCFGWIDGLRKSVDGDRYVIRFTPRKRASTWSVVNTRRAAELMAAGRMHAAGRKAFEARDPARSGVYSFEQRAAAKLMAAEEARFRGRAKAWRFFEAQPPWYRRTATFWVVSAKRAETRARRLATLIAESAAGRWIGPLRRPAGR